jgi:hypothetical protein
VNPLDELTRLTSLFDAPEALIAEAVHVPAAATPEPYKTMLAHDHHMTVEMESYHRCMVNVEVLADHLEGNEYSRKIILRNASNNRVVQFGIVRFNFDYVTPAVKSEILSKKIPLGRVLINHNVLRTIDLGAIIRVKAGPALAKCLEMPEGTTTYGRLATIFCNGKPAVDLLEITTPL